MDAISTSSEAQVSSPQMTSMLIEEENAFSSSRISPLSVLYIITYSLISVVAIGGNLVILYLILRLPSMRTVTNLFILNLALGDLLMSVLCIGPTSASNLLFRSWPFGRVLCGLVSYAQAVSVLVSAYSLLLISLDRYNALVRPLRRRCTKQHVHRFIGLIWVIALLTPAPIGLLSTVVPIGSSVENFEEVIANISTFYDDDSAYLINKTIITILPIIKYQCIEDWSAVVGRSSDDESSSTSLFSMLGTATDYKSAYSVLLISLQYLVPASVLIFTYLRIAHQVWGKRPPGEANCCRDERMARSKRKMIKMLILCVVAFTLCWLPFNVLLLVGDRYPSVYEYAHIELIWFAAHSLAMAHAAFNPLICITLNGRFRAGFIHLFGRICGCFNWSCCCCTVDTMPSSFGSVKHFSHQVSSQQQQNRLVAVCRNCQSTKRQQQQQQIILGLSNHQSHQNQPGLTNGIAL